MQGLSATCIGFLNGRGGQGLATMVSPRHYLFSTHMHPEANPVAFLDTNNIIHWRTTLERVDIPWSLTYGFANDISVGLLDSDLPASVGYLPVLPSDFTNYVPTNNVSIIQAIGMNQDMKLFSQPMTLHYQFIHANWSSEKSVPFGLGTNWNVALRGGDSSGPERFLIGNQLVLVAHNFGFGGGPIYALQLSTLNQFMHYLSTNNNVGTDYQLTTYPLTNWPTITQ